MAQRIVLTWNPEEYRESSSDDSRAETVELPALSQTELIPAPLHVQREFPYACYPATFKNQQNATGILTFYDTHCHIPVHPDSVAQDTPEEFEARNLCILDMEDPSHFHLPHALAHRAHGPTPHPSIEFDQALNGSRPISAGHDSGADQDHSAGDSPGPNDTVFSPQFSSENEVSPDSDYDEVVEDEISVLPPSTRAPSCEPHQTPTRSATKPRGNTHHSPFRNPSSVRALQLETTPPPFHLSSPSATRQQHRYRLNTPSRNSTPARSVRSTNTYLGSTKSASPKKQHPLVLLHITVLPIKLPYPWHIMQDVLPSPILANWSLLTEKINATVLERGILIAHPKEEYELLEERLLESLELRTGRILSCGHFHRRPSLSSSTVATTTTTTDSYPPTLYPHDDDHHHHEADLDNDPTRAPDLCSTCSSHVRTGQHGSSGAGAQRWDVKVYASNGLMRLGAWTAAWPEMERVDVEMAVWMAPAHRAACERQQEIYGAAMSAPVEAEAEEEEEPGAAEERESAGGGEKSPALEEEEEEEQHEMVAATAHGGRVSAREEEEEEEEEPLGTLLRRFALRQARDWRNVALVALGVAVVVLSMRAAAAAAAAPVTRKGVPAPGSSTSGSMSSGTVTPAMACSAGSSTAAVTGTADHVVVAASMVPAEQGEEEGVGRGVEMPGVLETVLEMVGGGEGVGEVLGD